MVPNMNIKVQRGSDPFKKYWWVLLVIFAMGGVWVCGPALQGGGGPVTGGAGGPGEGGLKSADGSSLDASANPSGAPGGAIDLSMDGAARRKKGEASGLMTSSLYIPPDDATAA